MLFCVCETTPVLCDRYNASVEVHSHQCHSTLDIDEYSNTEPEPYTLLSVVHTQVLSRQCGVFRTNCVDCLDRTNVVQGVLGRKALEAVLMSYGVLRQGEGLASVLPAGGTMSWRLCCQ